MNEMNLSDNQIEQMLGEVVAVFSPDDTLRESIRQQLLAQRQSTVKVQSPQRKQFMIILLSLWRNPRRRAMGFASVTITILAVFSTTMLWPQQLTMAQVQEAIEEKDWIHLKFDNGREIWTSLQRGVSAYMWEDGPKVYTIGLEGVQWWYMQDYSYPDNTPGYIHQRTISRSVMKPTAWLATVGWDEDIAEGKKKVSGYDVERHVEVIDDQLLFRFDGYLTDTLDRRILISQLWADPVSRLPVKVRERLQLARREEQGREFITGTYTFPDNGPESIYDLGVPLHIPIINRITGETSDQILDILDTAREFRHRFPEHYRAVMWTNDPAYGIQVLYWSGREEEEFDGEGKPLPDDLRAKFCYLHYFIRNKDYPEHHLDLPATRDEALAWSQSQSAVTTWLADGKGKEFSQRGPFPAPERYATPPEMSVRVMDIPWDHGFWNRNWPLSKHWPPVNRTAYAGPPEFLPLTDETPRGTIGIRKATPDKRIDYYLDPDHDYICIKHTTWKSVDDEWVIEREEVLSDLIQLPRGQWVATKRTLYQGGLSGRHISPSRIVWNIDITPLREDEFPPDIFNGEKLLEEAKKLGAKIESY